MKYLILVSSILFFGCNKHKELINGNRADLIIVCELAGMSHTFKDGDFYFKIRCDSGTCCGLCWHQGDSIKISFDESPGKIYKRYSKDNGITWER